MFKPQQYFCCWFLFKVIILLKNNILREKGTDLKYQFEEYVQSEHTQVTTAQIKNQNYQHPRCWDIIMFPQPLIPLKGNH